MHAAIASWRMWGLALALALAAGCATDQVAATRFEPVPLAELVALPSHYEGRYVHVEGYILGQVLQPEGDGAELWLIAIGEAPLASTRRCQQVIFPDVAVKVRAQEDGFNHQTLRRCYQLCREAQDAGQRVSLEGQFLPNARIQEYTQGIALSLHQLAFRGVLINTDYGDLSALQQQAPSTVKSIVKGLKKLANLGKKAIAL